MNALCDALVRINNEIIVKATKGRIGPFEERTCSWTARD